MKPVKSKGIRLNWMPLSQAKPIVLDEVSTKGRKVENLILKKEINKDRTQNYLIP